MDAKVLNPQPSGEQEEIQTPELTAHDRCDACGAQAYTRYELLAGGELLFCGHHSKTNGPALEGKALLVQDETSKLTERPKFTED